MEILVLGPIVIQSGDAVLTVDRPLERAALIRLALARGLPVPDRRLAADLWGDKVVDHPAQRLGNVLSRLRATLGAHADSIERTTAGYRCTATMPDLLAAEASAARLRAAQASGDQVAIRTEAAAALSRWRGPALADVPPMPFATTEAERLDTWRLEITLTWAAAGIETGAAHEVVTELSRLVATHPVHEHLGRLYALALYRTGRQADALGSMQRLRRALADQLGVGPDPETAALEQQLLRHDPRLQPPRMTSADELPEESSPTIVPGPTTTFLGREREMSVLRQLLTGTAPITLTGGPGCGKSRLALEAARAVARDGRRVVAVQLSGVRQGELVAQAIATAAGIDTAPGDEIPVLAAELDGALLLLDNTEHVADEVAAIITELRSATAGLGLLITSQKALGCQNEIVHPVSALDRRASLTLFADRAAGPVADSEYPDAVAICAAVDWLPLGIELAAGLTRTFSVPQLAQRIGDAVRLLVGGRRDAAGDRHTSLRTALDCSYDILDPATQSVLRAIGVCNGGFPPSAAAALLPADFDAQRVAAALAELEHRNLIAVLTDGSYRRCALLQTVRDYALSRLAAAGELAAVRARHTNWCLQHVQAAQRQHGESSAESAAAIFAEWPNISEALHNSPGTPAATAGLRLAIAMHRPWLVRGWYTQGAAYFTRLLDGTEYPAAERAEALSDGAFHLMMTNRLDEAADLLDEAATLLDPADSGPVTVSVHYCRGCIDIERARYQDAIRTLLMAADHAHRSGNLQRESACVDACATAQLFAGDARSAVENYRRGVDIDRADGDEHGLARGLSNLAKAYLGLGRLDAALACADESDDYAKRLDDRHILALTEQVRGGVAAATGNLDAAEVHCRTALSYMGDEISTADLDLADVLVERGQLDEARTLLDRVYSDTSPGRTTWFAARAVSAALSLAEGDRVTATALVEQTSADYSSAGFGWPRYVQRLTAVRTALAI